MRSQCSVALRILFMAYLFCVMVLGRPFCMLNFDTPWTPVYITEIMILLLIPLVFLHINELRKIPARFLTVGIFFIAIGVVHFVAALRQGRLLAVRDIVFFVYPMFFLDAFVTFLKEAELRKWQSIIVYSNIFGLIVGRILFVGFGSLPEPLQTLASNSKAIHWGFYYGVAVAFLVPMYPFIKSRILRCGTAVLLAMDIYMIFIFSERTIWIGVIILLMWLMIFLRKNFLRVFKRVLLAALLILPVLYYFDYIYAPTRMFHADIFASAKVTATRNVQFNKILGLTRATQELIVAVVQEEAEFAKAKRDGRSVDDGILVRASRMNFIAKAQQDAHDDLMTNSIYSIYWRIDTWIRYLTWLQHHGSFFGVGFGRNFHEYHNFEEPSPFDIQKTRQSFLIPPHNHIISVLFKLGIGGLSLYLFLIGYTFMIGMRTLRSLARGSWSFSFCVGALGMFMLWIVTALFFDFIESPPTSIFLWVSMALIQNISVIVKERRGHTVPVLQKHEEPCVPA